MINLLVDMSDAFKAKEVALRAQKKILGKMAHKNVAKAFISETTSSLLDNIYRLAKLKNGGNKKEAEKVVKNMIKIVIKVGILNKNDQFTQQEIKVAQNFQSKFQTISKAVISFYEVDFSYDRNYLMKSLEESHQLLRNLVRAHLTDKSLDRIDDIYKFFNDATFLDNVFNKNWAHRPLVGKIIDDMHHLIEEGSL